MFRRSDGWLKRADAFSSLVGGQIRSRPFRTEGGQNGHPHCAKRGRAQADGSGTGGRKAAGWSRRLSASGRPLGRWRRRQKTEGASAHAAFARSCPALSHAEPEAMRNLIATCAHLSRASDVRRPGRRHPVRGRAAAPAVLRLVFGHLPSLLAVVCAFEFRMLARFSRINVIGNSSSFSSPFTSRDARMHPGRPGRRLRYHPDRRPASPHLFRSAMPRL